MSTLDIAAVALEAAGDTTPLRAHEEVSGGDISQAAHVRTDGGEYLLKWGGRGRPGFFAAEARGLELLAASGAVRVPTVLAWRDANHTRDMETWTQGDMEASAGFILLEWLAAPPHADRAAAAAQLGAALATLHRATAPAYGLDADNYIGANPQPNGWRASWLHFFRDQRLGFQAELARRNGRLGGQRGRRVQLLLDRLDTWIDEGATRPALLHGDLWGGNWLIGPGGRPALIDPAAYYGDREADLAFTTLFGGFPDTFYRAYAEAWPLPAGAPARRDLYNLYHLLNHLNLFGEHYGGAVDATLQRYVG
jgi:fructosamine-3-kinase